MEIKPVSLKILDIEPYLAERAKLWRSSQIRSFFPLEHTPGVVSLLAGKPNPATFPIEAITLTVKSPVPDDATYNIKIEGQDLERALQYGLTGGLPDFVKWLEEFQTHVHGNDKDREGWQVVVGNGSQDLLTKAFQILVNEGDSILVETPAFPCAEGYFNLLPTSEDVEILNANGLPTPPASELVSVSTDGGGLSADHLRSILESWPSMHPNKKKPVILYTVPIAGNPTGATINEQRKAEVLRLAKEHDFLIFEDDAYAYLYYGDEPKPRSYFAMEAEINGEVGRVMRFDSFSKILSSGMRLGFITAPKRVCELIVLNTANVNLQCSSTTQMLALKLLSSWKHEGLVAHCDRVAAFYRVKRDMFEIAAQTHLKGVATWTTPVAGMFLFIELASLSDGTKLDSYKLIMEKAFKGGVLLVPGASFMPRGMKSSFVRASFSLADETVANEAFSRLRVVIDEARAEFAK